jgi:hypothetical protein
MLVEQVKRRRRRCGPIGLNVMVEEEKGGTASSGQ